MSKKLMIIDDEQSVCTLLTRVFAPEGYEVTSETDCEKALETIKNNRPDCVLLDIKMPKMDGVDMLTAIAKMYKDVAVIMITAYGNLETAMESMKLGAYDYITKPFDLDFIKTVVKSAMK